VFTSLIPAIHAYKLLMNREYFDNLTEYQLRMESLYTYIYFLQYNKNIFSH